MKFTSPRITLLSELQLVVRATALRSAVQALSGILVTAADDAVKLAATDMEIGLRSKVEGKVEENGSVLVPGRLLVDILRALDGEEVTLEHRAEKGELELRTGQARFAVRSLPAEDFPRLPEVPPAGAFTVSAKAFARTVEHVARAASKDDTRPVLTGILVSLSEDQLRMVATDSYRLSVKEVKVETTAPEQFEVNVPARALQELSRIVADVDTNEASVVAHENQVVFGLGRVTLSSRMIDGQFPNYQQLLPESFEHEIRVAKSELAAVVRRISLMAQRNTPLRLKFESGSATISAQTPDVGEASEALPLNYSGEPLEIGFNPQFLLDGLEGVEADELVLKLISALRPGLIEAAADGEGDEDGKFLYLIMPVRLNV
jgi:DNA polymerase III subunit beta